MISRTSERFRKLFAGLPKQVQEQAREVYKQFLRDPYYPSLHFKRVHSTKPIFSVRISIDYRALGVQDDNEMVWFWIGPHDKYERLLRHI